MADIRIVKTICPLSEVVDGWQKELNVVSVDGGPYAYDIREWSLNHFDYRDGITLDEKEATVLLMNLRRSFGLKDSDLDAVQIEMPLAETVPAPAPESAAAPVAPADNKPDVTAVLKEKGIAYVDKREYGGALWVIGDHKLDALMHELKSLGYKFYFSEKGGRVSKNQPAWFLRKDRENGGEDENDV